MNRPIRVLRQSDPARDLGLTLDERAEAELTALVGAAPTLPNSNPGRSRARSRIQQMVVTGLVAAAVVAITIPLLLHAPTGGRTTSGDDSVRDATVTPNSDTATPTPTPTLIAPDGWRLRTRAELHAFFASDSAVQDDKRNATIGEEQAWLDMQCMAEKGYVYDPIGEQADNTRHERGDRVATGLTKEQQQGYELAFWGKNTVVPYDWRDAGCHGRSVHLTGQDDAH